jgi:aminoglycoside phosphotransferase family enzyme
VGQIELLQTHISFVFLTGDYVYKVKKPVDFGFLDFTTLENRRFFCNEELRLNRRLCPDIYLEVVPINVSNGSIKVKGPGETVEYAVKMRELPQDAIMGQLLKEGRVTTGHVEEIAGLLAKFHEEVKTGEGIDEYGSLKQVRANWVENFEQTRGLRGGLLDAGDFDFVENAILSFMDENEVLFDMRVKKGRVRECHGDCHSGNIFILSDKIYIFDAIEFNKAFSCSDVAAEVAFLAMDLEFNGRPDLKEAFIKRYVEQSSDEGLTKLLPFYMCYRAYVRSKVASFKLGDQNISEEEKKEAEKMTVDYFNLSLDYAKALRD